jgi:hypothetical protein
MAQRLGILVGLFLCLANLKIDRATRTQNGQTVSCMTF